MLAQVLVSWPYMHPLFWASALRSPCPPSLLTRLCGALAILFVVIVTVVEVPIFVKLYDARLAVAFALQTASAPRSYSTAASNPSDCSSCTNATLSQLRPPKVCGDEVVLHDWPVVHSDSRVIPQQLAFDSDGETVSSASPRAAAPMVESLKSIQRSGGRSCWQRFVTDTAAHLVTPLGTAAAS